MEISKQQLVEFAQWMDDAARTIEKWAQHAPEYFKKKGRLLPDIDRFDQRAQAIRDFLAAAKDANPQMVARPYYAHEAEHLKAVARPVDPHEAVCEGKEEACGVHFTGHNMVDTPPPGQPPKHNIENENGQ